VTDHTPTRLTTQRAEPVRKDRPYFESLAELFEQLLVPPGGTAVLADVVDPGGWSTPQFHLDRAFADARLIYQLGGDADDAAGMLRLLLHPEWLDMTSADIPLSRPEFHHHYRQAFPGVELTDDLNPLMCGAVWRAPTAGADAAARPAT
jgi:hypothetical protein